MAIVDIKTVCTHNVGLVDRDDVMKDYIDFDPDAVYCGNVSLCSSMMCVAIAAKHELEITGGECLLRHPELLRTNPSALRHLKGYTKPDGMCIQVIGNLNGFSPARHDIFIIFDKRLKE